MSAIQIVVPPELVAICNAKLAEFVEVGFTKYVGGEEPMYYEHYIIRPSHNVLWERARNLFPPATRITIEQVLFIICKNNGIVVAPLPNQEESNDERLSYNCCCAVGKYIQIKLQEYLQAHPE